MMPTLQRCPGCHRVFTGSDAIGDLCPDCENIAPTRKAVIEIIKQIDQEVPHE